VQMRYYEKFTYMRDTLTAIFSRKSHKTRVKSLKRPTNARSRMQKLIKSWKVASEMSHARINDFMFNYIEESRISRIIMQSRRSDFEGVSEGNSIQIVLITGVRF
jgi:hypothetical protein